MVTAVDVAGTPRRFGRHIQHDPRSRGFRVANPDVVLKTVLWRNDAPVLDQGDLGSCTGNAMAACVNSIRSSRDRVQGWLSEEHAVTLYSQATTLDDIPGTYPPEDTGSSGLAVAKAAHRAGYINSYRHAFGLQDMLAALQAGPVIVGTVWLDGMNTPRAGAVLTVSGAELGGHEYLIRGADMESQLLTMQNSWSDQWGEGGCARISFRDMEALLGAQGDCTVPVI